MSLFRTVFPQILLSALLVLLVGCNRSGKPVSVERPSFSGDSAYAYVEHQLAFGPRVPHSKGHTDCAVWLVQQLKRFGAQVELQKGTLPDYAGRPQPIINIIGHFPSSVAGNPSPIILCAHYDTRAWCDEEELYEDRTYNVPGANDGASGVAVLLEVARQIGADSSLLKQPVDIVFFDYEDQGTPRIYTGVQRENTWCLGSQLFAMQYPNKQARYRFGILLDMVGAPDAVFPREMYSTQYAQNYVEQIWRKAHQLGYGRYFVDKNSFPITDDHYYLNLAGIPCVDIIHYDTQYATGFASWWHTRQDNIQNVDKSTLQAVGEVVLSVVAN
jgi:Zn-dependent M28 family amino/carboxypeptidase